VRAAITGVIRLAAHRKQSVWKVAAATVAVALGTVALVGVGPASATIRSGDFICNAVAGRLGPGYMGNANPAGSPCVDDYTFVKTGNLGPAITITGATAATDQTPDDLDSAPITPYDSANAFAGAAAVFIRIGTVTIGVGAVTSNATAQCNAYHNVTLSSSSRVVGLSINGGAARIVTGYLKINVLGLVVIELNKVTLGYHTRTQQALVVSSALASGKLVVGEATAGYDGHPCNAART
jgi:hypothetical protein